VEPLEIGAPVATVLDPKRGNPAEAWYSATLQGADYRVSIELTRSDRRKSNVQGSVDVFGPLGEELDGLKQVCAVNEIALAAKCTSKLSLANETRMLFRLIPSNDSAYKADFKVEPYPE
jgi:hypothetical protein